MKTAESEFSDHALANPPDLESSRYNWQLFFGYLSSIIGKKHLGTE